VTIDADARYTNSPHVHLEIREPPRTTAVEISNSPAFDAKDTRSLERSFDYEWTLDESASDLDARTVYVRFPGSGTGQTYSDEIILDRRAPLVGGATISRKRGKSRRWVLRVVADDGVSGVDLLHTSGKESGTYKEHRFDDRITVRKAKHAKSVRVSDFAGNVSDPVPVRRRGR
jgi:hypothetical protein